MRYFKVFGFTMIAFVVFGGIFSCVPPKEVSKVEYRYLPNGVYNYSLEVRASGNFSYLFINYTGDMVIKSDVEMSVFEAEKGKYYYFLRFSNIKVEGIPSSIVEGFSNVSFYMDSKGNKYVDNIFLHYILDILIPILPDEDITNESRFRTSSFNIEGLDVLGEVSNSTVVSNRDFKGFNLGYISSIKILELEYRDIVVGEFLFNGSTKIVGGILEGNNITFTSGTMIPLSKSDKSYLLPITQVVGFKGKGSIEIKRKENI